MPNMMRRLTSSPKALAAGAFIHVDEAVVILGAVAVFDPRSNRAKIGSLRGGDDVGRQRGAYWVLGGLISLTVAPAASFPP